MPPAPYVPIESMLMIVASFSNFIGMLLAQLQALLAQLHNINDALEELILAELAHTDEGDQQVSSEPCVNVDGAGSPIEAPRERSRSPRR